LFPFPTLRVGVPNAVVEQAIQIGKIWVTVVVEAQAFAIFLARPFAIPHLPPRIIRVEVQRMTAMARRIAVWTTEIVSNILKGSYVWKDQKHAANRVIRWWRFHQFGVCR